MLVKWISFIKDQIVRFQMIKDIGVYVITRRIDLPHAPNSIIPSWLRPTCWKVGLTAQSPNFGSCAACTWEIPARAPRTPEESGWPSGILRNSRVEMGEAKVRDLFFF